MFAQKVQMSTMLDANSPETISHLPVHTLVERAEMCARHETGRAGARIPAQSGTAAPRAACQQDRSAPVRVRTVGHRILTHQYRDGHASLDVTFDQVRDAEHALVALLEDIQLHESELADMRSTYHDIALWEAR